MSETIAYSKWLEMYGDDLPKPEVHRCDACDGIGYVGCLECESGDQKCLDLECDDGWVECSLCDGKGKYVDDKPIEIYRACVRRDKAFLETWGKKRPASVYSQNAIYSIK